VPVLVYGSGTLAFSAIALVRHLYPGQEIWAATRSGRSSAAPLMPWSGKEWLQDGPGVVYDTIGSAETVETSLRLLASSGTLVVSGVEPPKRFEWTPMYFKELRVVGSNGFGIEEVAGVKKHAFEHYFDFALAGMDLTPVVTHRYALERWREAVLTLADARTTGAVKVLLEPGA
jgi:threonine dehydrogenase-like Zn-dependent dehydrogenase